MYKEGIQIGDKSYLLQDEDKLVLATIEGTPEQMKEYIKMVNECDEIREKISFLTREFSEIHYKDKKARKHSIETFITTCFIDGLFVTLSLISGSFPMDVLIIVPTICIGTGIISKFAFYGTKKKRKCEKKKIGEQILEMEKEHMKLKNKINELKYQMEYSETRMTDDKNITVTTVENKKVNLKTRVLRLDQSR